MKKITFILLALIAGTSFAQVETAEVFAEIVSPIKISSESDLNFGTINGTATGGDVSVAFNGNRTFTNTDMEVTSAVTTTAASFSIIAASGYVYSITIPDTQLNAVVGSSVMDVTFNHNRNNVSRRTGSGEGQDLLVGGTLTVGDNQDEGEYAGEVEVTVAYE